METSGEMLAQRRRGKNKPDKGELRRRPDQEAPVYGCISTGRVRESQKPISETMDGYSIFTYEKATIIPETVSSVEVIATLI